jgi:hypothetical protein
MEQAVSDIEAMIREEKRQTAAESHSEAWAEGVSAGIEPEIIAEAALTTAIAELVRCCGEDAAAALLERMRERTQAGEFEPLRHLH